MFYSSNSNNLTFEMYKSLMETKADVEYIKAEVGGKNALDFQLSTIFSENADENVIFGATLTVVSKF